MRSGLGIAIATECGQSAVLSAVADALYGSIGVNDEKKEIEKAVSQVEGEFYIIGNVDVVLIADKENHIPDLEETKKLLAESLHIEETQVNMKTVATPFPGMVIGEAAYIAQAVVGLDTIDNFSYEIDPENMGDEMPACGGCGGCAGNAGSKCATCGGCMRADIEDENE